MKKEKRRPMVFRAIAVRVISLTAALWFAIAGLLTWAVAEDFYGDIKLYSYADSIPLREDGSYDELAMIDELRRPYYAWPEELLPIVANPRASYSSDDWIYGKWDLLYGYEAAVAFYDTDLKPIVQTGHYITFEYTTQANWEAENVDPVGMGYLALEEIEGGIEAMGRYLADDLWFPLDLLCPLLRLTGYFEGEQFHPTVVEINELTIMDRNPHEINYLDLNRNNVVEWGTILNVEPPVGQELETIYAWSQRGTSSDLEPVTVNGREYGSLLDLLHANVAGTWDHRDSLVDAVMVSVSRYDNGVAAKAIRCWPLQYAMLRLLPFYGISLAVVGLALWLILRTIYKNLTSPLLDLAVSTGISQPTGWWEVAEVKKKLNDARQSLAESNTKLTQTQTALDYAQNAEENRKKLVSDLAHELKTPLAIIHSYAEGLLDGIAADKKDQYLAVILEQSERMDALVLQMLDLSRLEAGKVRLTPEPVALLKLTQTVTDRFGPLLEEKELTLHYDMAENLTVMADEARVEQVITNLVSNAVKYTPVGGRIRINLYQLSGTVYFFLENTAPHLSDEALEKVWDSFYRADPSRREPGTGLGLALVRGVIQLHGGQCSVRNTTVDDGATAVEFGFTLPAN